MYKGNYQGVKKVRYTVIAGYDDIHEIDWPYSEIGKRKCYETAFCQVLGTYDDAETAYGQAYMYLSETKPSEECTVTLLNHSTEDTGYYMSIVNPDPEARIREWAWVLFDTIEEEEED